MLQPNQENESFYNVENSGNKDLSTTNIKHQKSISLNELPSDYSKMESPSSVITDTKDCIEDEKMDISEYFEPEEVDDLIGKETVDEKFLMSENEETILLLTDDEEEKETVVSNSKLENTNLILTEDSEISIEMLSSSTVENKAEASQQTIQMDQEKSSSPQFITMKPLIIDNSEPNTQSISSNYEKSRSYNENIFLPSSIINSNDTKYVKEHISDDDDNDVIILDSEDENSPSGRSSSINSIHYSDDCSDSDESELDNTRYGRFKSQNRGSSEDTGEERSYASEEEEDDEQIDVEQSGIFSEDNLSIEGEMCSDVEILSSEDDEEKINSEQCDVSSDEDKTNSLELQNEEYYENSREENNCKQNYVEIDDDNNVEENLKHDFVEVGDENNLKHDEVKSNNDNNSEQNNTKFDGKDEKSGEQHNDIYLVESDENDSKHNDVHFDKGEEHNSGNENDKSYDLSANEECDFKSNKLENLIPCAFNLDEENYQPNYNYTNENIVTAKYNDTDVDNINNIDSNITDHESNQERNELSTENKSINYEQSDDGEVQINVVENVGINVPEEYSFANNDNYFEMPNRESSPIPESGFNFPDNGFNHPAMEIEEPNQIKMFEVDTNQSTPFLFGESFFGQQEIPENKPMFLFGQVYSFEKEKIATDSNSDKHEVKDSVIDSTKDVVINVETEEVVDVDDGIEDILELESLPESNPDENSDVQKSSKTNILHAETKESDKTFDQSIPLNNYQKSLNSDSQNIYAVQVFENQNTETCVELPNTNIAKNFNRNSDNDELSQNIMNTEETLKLSYDVNDDEKNKEIPHIFSLSTENMNTNSKHLRSTRAKSEQKELSKIISQSKRNQSVPPDSKIECSHLIENETLKSQKSDKSNFLSNQTSSEISNEHSRCISSSHKLPTVITNENINLKRGNPIESKLIGIQSNSSIVDSAIPESTITLLSENKPRDDTESQEKNKDDFVTSFTNKSIPENKESSINQSLNYVHVPEKISNKVKEIPYICLEQPSSQQLALIENKLRQRSRSEQPHGTTTSESKNITLQPVDFTIDEKTNKAQKHCISKSVELIKTKSANLEDMKFQVENNTPFDAQLKIKPSLKIEENLINQSLNIKQHSNIEYDKTITCINQERPSSSNELKLRRSRRAKSEQPLNKTTVELKNPFVFLGPQFDNIEHVQKVSHEKELHIADKTSKNENNQEVTLKSRSRRESLRKNVSKANKSNSDILDDVSKKTTHKIKILTDQTEESVLKISNSYVNDQIDEHTTNQDTKKGKEQSTIPPQNLDVIKTRLRARSETKVIKPESSSSNMFRSSEIIEDNTRQVRVSLSKKRSKSQENLVSAKRRSGRSKSLAPIEKKMNTRRTVFGLEQIPEEDTSKSDKNVLSKHATVTRKSKFNFLSNKSKLIEHENTSLNVQDKKVKTPRRSKSVQPDTALTFSLVKTKPKRSSSVNLLISDDNNSTRIDNFMGVLKKALVSPVKIKKRSLTESAVSRKKQKYTKQVKSENSESGSIGSNENSNDFNSSSDEEFSPIAGNNSQNMLFTPSRRQTKVHMADLDSENEVSSNESTDSKRIMTRSVIQKNSSFMELEPVSVIPAAKATSKMSMDKQKNTFEIEKSSKKITEKADNILLLPKRGIKTTKVSNNKHFSKIFQLFILNSLLNINRLISTPINDSS